jgi:arylsulfatase
MEKNDQQFNSQPKQTRDGWPVRQGLGVMPGGADTYLSYGRGWANVSDTPFREYKHWTHEGGISTPLIAHWPAGLATSRRGNLEAQPGQLVDIMATCLDVAGANYPREFHGEKIKPMEGTSLRPALEGKALQRSKPLVWEHEGNRAIRDGQWKLVAKENKPWELYNLETDRGEQRDLASSEPARVKAMSADWDAWAARANVLPLGAWRDRTNALSKETRFVLKAGDHLDRADAPAIARRGFTITASFNNNGAKDGVLVAQGGTAHGYALFLADGKLCFMVRSSTGAATATATLSRNGTHKAVAHFDGKKGLSLTLDDQPETSATARGPVNTMPVDGLDIGADNGGAVGPYSTPNKFTGRIESMIIELTEP